MPENFKGPHRWRKLLATILALVLLTLAQLKAGGEAGGLPITWPYAVAMVLVVFGFTVPDLLDKALQSGALGNLGGLSKLPAPVRKALGLDKPGDGPPAAGVP